MGQDLTETTTQTRDGYRHNWAGRGSAWLSGRTWGRWAMSLCAAACCSFSLMGFFFLSESIQALPLSVAP